MSVAVAHHTRSSSGLALAEGARQAAYRGTDLVVIHVVDSLDNDIAEANKAGISDAVRERPRRRPALADLRWDVRLVAGGREIAAGVGGAARRRARSSTPTLLVIGARRRSPMGKAFLGSVAQNVILDADVPVLVVKSGK